MRGSERDGSPLLLASRVASGALAAQMSTILAIHLAATDFQASCPGYQIIVEAGKSGRTGRKTFRQGAQYHRQV